MNDMDQFVELFGGVYEHSPWIAEAVFKGGSRKETGTADSLHLAMKVKVDGSDTTKKLKLLHAHPDLAGKLAMQGELTAESANEQASADLGNCTADEFQEFQNLNARYKEKFGFPFILAVRGFQRSEILEIFRKRVNNDYDVEFEEALNQVHRIALLRLQDIF